MTLFINIFTVNRVPQKQDWFMFRNKIITKPIADSELVMRAIPANLRIMLHS